jgi:radical SAM superfamily enzyme YgiQ (UPF0313 family)
MDRKIKKIAFINPKRSLSQENQEIYKMFERNKDYLKLWFAPPLSLLVIASLTPKEFEVKIIDEHFEEIDFDADYDLIGLTAMTQQALRAYEIAGEFKLRNKTVVMGGIHATILTDEVLQHVDTVIAGEAEELWGKYLEDLSAGNAKEVYRSDNLFNLKKAITPSYDFINFSHFNEATSYFRFLPVQATRGCPHDCSFCITSKYYGRRIRKKNISQVVLEIKYLKECSNNSLLLFVDDNLFVDRKFAYSLLKELIPLKIKYIAQSDVKIADDPELLRLAYLSGCVMLFIGFESINPVSINHINANSWKMKQISRYPESIKKIQENGIVVFGAFIIGFENDTLSTFDDICDFVTKNKIPAQFTLLTPLPGSREYEKLEKTGKLTSKVFWNKCSFFSMTFNHANLSIEEAERKIIWLHDQVFKKDVALQRNLNMINIYKNLPPRWVL